MNNISDVTARLNNIKALVEKGKTERAKAEANLDTFGKQKESLIAELAGYGVTPEGLDAEIARLDQEIAENLARAEELLKGGA